MRAVRWSVFQESSPELAGFGRSRLDSGPAYLATTRSDGSPRVHPVSPYVRGGLLVLYMFPTSPKGHDLRDDDRYALHSSVTDRSGTGGEFAVRGRAVWGEGDISEELSYAGFSNREGYVRFELLLAYVVVATYDDDSNVPTLQRWKAGRQESAAGSG